MRYYSHHHHLASATYDWIPLSSPTSQPPPDSFLLLFSLLVLLRVVFLIACSRLIHILTSISIAESIPKSIAVALVVIAATFHQSRPSSTIFFRLALRNAKRSAGVVSSLWLLSFFQNLELVLALIFSLGVLIISGIVYAQSASSSCTNQADDVKRTRKKECIHSERGREAGKNIHTYLLRPPRLHL